MHYMRGNGTANVKHSKQEQAGASRSQQEQAEYIRLLDISKADQLKLYLTNHVSIWKRIAPGGSDGSVALLGSCLARICKTIESNGAMIDRPFGTWVWTGVKARIGVGRSDESMR